MWSAWRPTIPSLPRCSTSSATFAGCGFWTSPAATAESLGSSHAGGARVASVDISGVLLERARTDEIEKPLGVTYLKVDATLDRALAGETFDAVRFASAETVRWMEEATGSYQYFVIGFTLILLAALIVWTARIPRPIGYLLGLNAVGYLVSGWIHGVAGFVPQGALPFLLGEICFLIASVWLLIAGWRMPESPGIAPGSGSPASARSR